MLDNNKKIKYIRLDSACEQLGCSRSKVRKIATDAKALYKIDRVLLIDIQKMNDYIEQFFLVQDGF